MRLLRAVILAIGVMGLASACGGSDKGASTMPATHGGGPGEEHGGAANPCAGGHPCEGHHEEGHHEEEGHLEEGEHQESHGEEGGHHDTGQKKSGHGHH